MSSTTYLSKSFLTAFRNWCSGNLVLKQIDEAFQDAGDFSPDTSKLIPAHISGQRRTRVQEYLNGIDLGDEGHLRRFLNVVGFLLTQQEPGSDSYTSLEAACRQAGLVLERGQLYLRDPISTDWLTHAEASFDRAAFAAYVDRIQRSITDDPSAAIGASKELVEAVCKYVLRASGTPATGDEALPTLSKKAQAALNLTAEGIPETARGADSMKKVLGSMGVTVHGLAELRNLYGTGHGRDGVLRGIKPRHARLAVGAATTLCTFLLETLEERQRV